VSTIAIQVNNLHKKYELGVINSGTLSRDLNKWWARYRGKEESTQKIGESASRSEYWALRNLDFTINKGDSVGIIGRNGAGKSTLLKILSRVTSPTIGNIKLRGRVASLLEVGTGFHPDLTGRENIFMNGAILGMSRQEIFEKLDEIIDFSGVEQHIDTPVKRYSSGMYVRLAFAVAAHLEPEIMIVDEVLAVGDAEFQKRCLGKMENVASDGRTILFVSHNMAAVKSLCTTGIYLSKGNLIEHGPVQQCISRYLLNDQSNVESDLEKIENRSGNGKVIFSSFHIENTKGEKVLNVLTGDAVCLVFKLKVQDPTAKKIDLGFSLHDSHDDMEAYLYSSFQAKYFQANESDYLAVKCTLNSFPFSKGKLFVRSRVLVNGIEADWPKEAIGTIDIEFGDFYETGATTENMAPFLIKGDWE